MSSSLNRIAKTGWTFRRKSARRSRPISFVTSLRFSRWPCAPNDLVADTHRLGFLVARKSGCVSGEPTKPKFYRRRRGAGGGATHDEAGGKPGGQRLHQDSRRRRQAHESPVPLSNRSRGKGLAKHLRATTGRTAPPGNTE